MRVETTGHAAVPSEPAPEKNSRHEKIKKVGTMIFLAIAAAATAVLIGYTCGLGLIPLVITVAGFASSICIVAGMIFFGEKTVK